MKTIKNTICIAVLILVSVAVLLFLSLFTVDSDQTINFIDFTSCTLKNQDGTLTELTMEEYFAMPQPPEAACIFSAVITEENYDDYIQFTAAGMDLTVTLGNTQVYHSDAILPDEVIDQITARVPICGMALPLTVTMECRMLGGVNAIFPPMLFTTSDITEMIPNLAYGHRGGIPAGAFAAVLLLLSACFLYSILEGAPRYSLLSLIAASAVSMIYGICQQSGYLFLPEWMGTVFTWDGWICLLFISLLTYFACNIHRAKLFFQCFLISGSILIFACFISQAANGLFAATVKEFLTAWISYGDYIRPMIWICYWLQLVCVLVAVITALQSFSAQIAREQAFSMKADIAMENYRMMEEQSLRDAVLRHEFRNHLTSLKLMLEQNKQREAVTYLEELEHHSQSNVKYTENFAINAILQNGARRAEDLGFQLEAYVRAGKELSISESDLCTLLFNMLDNAFEAVSHFENPAERKLCVRIKQRDSALGIYCENTYLLPLELDRNGNPRSHKKQHGHGIGIAQMERIAKKYGGKMDFSYSDEVFIAQTVLFLPS